MIIRLLPDDIFLVKVKHCSPQGKFPLGPKITAFGPSLRKAARNVTPQGEDKPWCLSSSSTGTNIPLEVSLS